MIIFVLMERNIFNIVFINTKYKWLNNIVNFIFASIIIVIACSIAAGILWVAAVVALSIFKVMPPVNKQYQIYIATMVFLGALVTICFNASNNSKEPEKEKFYNIALGLFYGLLNFGFACLLKYILEEYIPFIYPDSQETSVVIKNILGLALATGIFLLLFLFSIHTIYSIFSLFYLLSKMRKKFFFPT